MKHELELKLQEDYSFMKQNRVSDERNTYRRFGCECGNGWYKLIQKLCQEITEKYAEYQLSVDIVVLQVKGKFGKLRFYYEYEDTHCKFQALDFIGDASVRFAPEKTKEEAKQRLRKEIAMIVRKYERKSDLICEICGGENATLRNVSTRQYYIKTVCDKCYEEYMRNQANT